MYNLILTPEIFATSNNLVPVGFSQSQVSLDLRGSVLPHLHTSFLLVQTNTPGLFRIFCPRLENYLKAVIMCLEVQGYMIPERWFTWLIHQKYFSPRIIKQYIF